MPQMLYSNRSQVILVFNLLVKYSGARLPVNSFLSSLLATSLLVQPLLLPLPLLSSLYSFRNTALSCYSLCRKSVAISVEATPSASRCFLSHISGGPRAL